MKKNRIIASFTIIAILSAVLVSFLVYHYLNPARGIIYVFNDDYQTGQQVTKDMLMPLQVDMSIISGGAKGRMEDQFVTSSGYESIVTSGDTLKMDVAKGMPLTRAMLSKIGGSSIEMNMKPTSIAITIPVNGITGVTNDIQPGAHVNVYFASGMSQEQYVQLILQNMKVLAVYKEEAELSGVSLEVTPDESLELVYAQNYGDVYLGLVDAAGYQSVEEESALTYSPSKLYELSGEQDYEDFLDSLNEEDAGSEEETKKKDDKTSANSTVLSDEEESEDTKDAEGLSDGAATFSIDE